MALDTPHRILLYAAVAAGGGVLLAASAPAIVAGTGVVLGTAAAKTGLNLATSLASGGLCAELHSGLTRNKLKSLENHDLQKLTAYALAMLIRFYKDEQIEADDAGFFDRVRRSLPLIANREDKDLAALADAATKYWSEVKLDADSEGLDDPNLHKAFTDHGRTSPEPYVTAEAWEKLLQQLADRVQQDKKHTYWPRVHSNSDLAEYIATHFAAAVRELVKQDLDKDSPFKGRVFAAVHLDMMHAQAVALRDIKTNQNAQLEYLKAIQEGVLALRDQVVGVLTPDEKGKWFDLLESITKDVRTIIDKLDAIAAQLDDHEHASAKRHDETQATLIALQEQNRALFEAVTALRSNPAGDKQAPSTPKPDHPALTDEQRAALDRLRHAEDASARYLAAVGRGDQDEADALWTQLQPHRQTRARQAAELYLLRGTQHYYAQRYADAIDAWSAIAALPDAPADQRAKALVNRGFMKGEQGDLDGALADYTAVLNIPDAPVQQQAMALVNRGSMQGEQGDLDGALADSAAVLDLPDAPAEQRAQALFNRGVAKGLQGDPAGAAADYTAVLDLPDAAAKQRADALNNRGVTKRRQGDREGAVADYDAVLDIPDAPAEQKAHALVNRGVVKRDLGDPAGALADYTAVIDMPDAPAEQKAHALVNRGVVKRDLGDPAGALADYTAVIDMPDDPAKLRAWALYNHGAVKRDLGDPNGAIADYDAVLAMPDAPGHPRAQALVNRGSVKYKQGDPDSALADWTAAVNIPNAPPKPRAQALYNRGVVKGRQGDPEGAIADYTTVLAMPDAPADPQAWALYNRGVVKGRQGDPEGAIADYTTVLAMPDAPTEPRVGALFNLGCTKALQGEATAAIGWLEQWRDLDQGATQKMLDNGRDFDAIREDPEFVAFRDTLPPG